MQRRYPLTDYEAHIVRETPEMGWDADTTREAEDRDRLPIDLPAIDDDPEPWQQLTRADWAQAIGVAVAVTGALSLVWVLL